MDWFSEMNHKSFLGEQRPSLRMDNEARLPQVEVGEKSLLCWDKEKTIKFLMAISEPAWQSEIWRSSKHRDKAPPILSHGSSA